MTELLHKEFSRKTLLKGGGSLVVGFSLAGAGFAGRAQAAESPFASNGPGDMWQIDTWLTIHADNTASVRYGYPEVGTGSSTGMLQIVGEELDMAISQLSVVRPDTNLTPDTGTLTASRGINTVGQRVRAAAASARQVLLGLASANLGVPVSALTVASGVVSGGGRSVTYGQLIGDKLFNVRMPANYIVQGSAPLNDYSYGLIPGAAPAKPVSQYKLVGTTVPRIDIPDKVTGTFTYVHNIRVPGMIHGRLVRPRGQGAYPWVPKVLAVDESSIKNIPGARVVRKGDFVGVVAAREYDAIRAAAQLKVTWDEPPALPTSGNLVAAMREQDSAGETPASVVSTPGYGVPGTRGNVDAGFASAARVISQSYSSPATTFGVIGPCCAVADVRPEGASVFTNTQGPYETRGLLSTLLGLPVNRVKVTFVEGSSSYGGGSWKDVPEAAALMSQLAGKPVRLQLMRWDEHGWSNTDKPVLMDIRGGIDRNGNIVALDATSFGLPSVGNFYPTGAAAGLPIPAPGTSASSRSDPRRYSTPNWRWTVKTLPVNRYFMSSYFRGVSQPHIDFGYEQMIDELAHAANMDPVAFRRQNIARNPVDPVFSRRWLDLLDALARTANWTPRVSAANLSTTNVVAGRGIALSYPDWSGSVTGAIADIEVNKKTGKIIVKHLVSGVESGLILNMDAVENQIIGGAIMAVSRTLHEALAFDRGNITSLDWVTYPILRFKDTPKVTPVILNRPDQPPHGVGEEGLPPVTPAIANAFFDATGVRMRSAPMTPVRVRAVLEAAGK
jgi:CO/xanthine dehydrogenase Mo-binding subunit